MKAAMILLGLVLLSAGCMTYPWTSKHVPVVAGESSEEKVMLAGKVLAALPVARVREQIQERYPELSVKQLKRINLYHTEGRQPQLVVRIDHDRKLHPIARQIDEFVASLFREELARQRALSNVAEPALKE